MDCSKPFWTPSRLYRRRATVVVPSPSANSDNAASAASCSHRLYRRFDLDNWLCMNGIANYTTLIQPLLYPPRQRRQGGMGKAMGGTGTLGVSPDLCSPPAHNESVLLAQHPGAENRAAGRCAPDARVRMTSS